MQPYDAFERLLKHIHESCDEPFGTQIWWLQQPAQADFLKSYSTVYDIYRLKQVTELIKE